MWISAGRLAGGVKLGKRRTTTDWLYVHTTYVYKSEWLPVAHDTNDIANGCGKSEQPEARSWCRNRNRNQTETQTLNST